MTTGTLNRYPDLKPKMNGSYLCQIGEYCFEIMHWKDGVWVENDWDDFDPRFGDVVGWVEFPEYLPIKPNKLGNK